MTKGVGLFPPNPAVLDAAVQAKRSSGAAGPVRGMAAEFHRNMFRIDAHLDAISVVLCDDKPNSFGAPDILQVSFVQPSTRLLLLVRCEFSAIHQGVQNTTNTIASGILASSSPECL